MEHANHQIVEISYWLAFMTGVLGSAHCLGMCGGLVSSFFMRLGARTYVPYLAYHAARVLVYGLIGLTAATFGTVLVQTGILGKTQGILEIVAGLIVILLGLDMLGLSPVHNKLRFVPLAWIHKQFAAAAQRGPVIGATIGGAINGLMPCSMTMAMAVHATTAPSPVDGGLLLLAFGAGTLPSMLTASFLFGRLGVKTRGWLLRGAALFVIALGLLTVWHGIRFYSKL